MHYQRWLGDPLVIDPSAIAAVDVANKNLGILDLDLGVELRCTGILC